MNINTNLKVRLWICMFLVITSGATLADTHYVNPGGSIQAAINDAAYGDTVEMASGTYVELITLKNGVALIGPGASTTTIDGNASDSVVFSNDCDPNTILQGFTITNGKAGEGGGMYNYSGSPTVTHCTFTRNTADFGGGMYYNSNSSLTIANCILWGDSPNEIDNYSSTPSTRHLQRHSGRHRPILVWNGMH